MTTTHDDVGIFARLPKGLQPRSEPVEGSGRRRRAELAILVVLGVLLAAASIYDVTRQVGINYRLTADITTWQEVTGKSFKELDIEQNVKTYTKRDIVCGNTTFSKPGKTKQAKPGETQQICLVMKGPIVKGRREVTGGFFLPPEQPNRYPHRYGCFGHPVSNDFCGSSAPPGEPMTLPKAFGG